MRFNFYMVLSIIGFEVQWLGERLDRWATRKAYVSDPELRALLDQSGARDMPLIGQFAPDGGDGYIPGFWDHLRSEYMAGNVTPEAYDRLRAVLDQTDTKGN